MITEIIEDILKTREFRSLITDKISYRRLISDMIMYICDTRDYKGAIEFLKFTTYSTTYNERLVSFLRQKKDLSDSQIYDLCYQNIVRRGLVFHGTSRIHMDEIQSTGLRTISDMYGSNFRYEVLEINQAYQTIYSKKNGVGINSVDPIKFGRNDDSFNMIYLTPVLKIALDYSFNPTEWFAMYYKNMVSNANLPMEFCDYYGKNYDLERRTFEKACNLICGNENDYYKLFMAFYDKYYPKKKMVNEMDSCIVLVSVKAFENYEKVVSAIPRSFEEFRVQTNNGYPLHEIIRQFRLPDDKDERNKRGSIEPNMIEVVRIYGYEKDGYLIK